MSSPSHLILCISIHALFAEGDLPAAAPAGRSPHFYPRPLRRGRPPPYSTSNASVSIFLSTPSSQRATAALYFWWDADQNFYPRPLRRGRLGDINISNYMCIISIHALFAEGDPSWKLPPLYLYIFLSTPSSQRATQARAALEGDREIFLSTPSSQRATARIPTRSRRLRFLSTPSSQRATAGADWQSAAAVRFLSTPSSQRATGVQ